MCTTCSESRAVVELDATGKAVCELGKRVSFQTNDEEIFASWPNELPRGDDVGLGARRQESDV